MYLKLSYSVFADEIEAVLEDSLSGSLRDTPLWAYSRVIVSAVINHYRDSFTPSDLERAALLETISTVFLSSHSWAKSFAGLGKDPSTNEDISNLLASFIQSWQATNPTLSLSAAPPADPRSLLIPVEVPPVTIVHTADIRLSPTTPLASADSNGLAVTTNRLLPATLHLKWTRVWDTATPRESQTDLEFSYELTAPQDTWLLGGRRKGHFVIPALPPNPDVETTRSLAGQESTPDTEADIPILLIPLREGWLPYPGVEIREVPPTSAAVSVGSDSGQMEVDYKNFGETIRVLADRQRVTLSLDASGPGGGPLVLDLERRGLGGRVVA